MIISPARSSSVRPRAAARVETLLRTYGVREPEPLRQHVTEILDAAEQQLAIQPDRSLVELAAEETQSRVAAWLEALVGPGTEPAAVRFARARAAIHLTRLPENWPGAMLVLPTPLPPEVVERVRATYLAAGPDLDFASMVPRPIDLGIVRNIADETWKTFTKWPVLRGAFISSLFLTLLGTVFYLVRF